MNPYLVMKERHQKELGDFPLFFAFSDEQFARGMNKLGLKETDTDRVYGMGNGCYYKKCDRPELFNMLVKHIEELAEAIRNDENFAEQALTYELANHEYNITMDVSEALNALNLTEWQVEIDPALNRALQKAIKNQGDPF